MQPIKTVFFRNDDIRNTLDQSLIYLTETILSEGLCISLAVEPANVSKLVADWLLKKKTDNPDHVEIIQHGLNHSKKAGTVKGEFGGDRSYNEQLSDITRGRKLMDDWFGSNWYPAFSFPYGTYNKDTLRALDFAGYPVITTGVRWTIRRRILNSIGLFLRLKHLARRNIVYTGKVPPGYSFLELPVVLNNTKEYLRPDGGVQKTKVELVNEWKKIPIQKTFGVLTHHRYNSKNDIDQLISFLLFLKEQGTNFTTLERIHNEEMDHMQRS